VSPRPLRILPAEGPLGGTITLPGDKSVSHRALLLNALAAGEARIGGLNDGADLSSSARCLRALGVSLRADGDQVLLRGRAGRFRTPSSALDCGNSGTTMRLLAGMLASQSFTATLDGDASLRARPMQRIAEPLRALGARVEGPDNGEHPPLIVTGGPLRAGRFELAVASAQLKSCLLLAAVGAGIELSLREPALSRDHTERMLSAMGAQLTREGDWIHLQAGAVLRCVDLHVPADPSSAALVAAAACCIPGSEVRFPGVLLNPTRTRFFDKLEAMGVSTTRRTTGSEAGEEVGELRLRAPERLLPITVDAAEMPSMIDEIPALAALACFAEGRSQFDGVAELRVKESDRVVAIESLCESVGVETGATEENLWVEGGSPRVTTPLRPADDHRMAMSAIALAVGLAARGGEAVEVEGVDSAAISFPNFLPSLEAIGVRTA